MAIDSLATPFTAFLCTSGSARTSQSTGEIYYHVTGKISINHVDFQDTWGTQVEGLLSKPEASKRRLEQIIFAFATTRNRLRQGWQLIVCNFD